MDGRKKNGGKRPNSGRKPKADEESLIERLSKFDESAFRALKNGLSNDDHAFLKLFFSYRYGLPKQTIDLQGQLNVTSIKITDVDGTEI